MRQEQPRRSWLYVTGAFGRALKLPVFARFAFLCLASLTFQYKRLAEGVCEVKIGKTLFENNEGHASLYLSYGAQQSSHGVIISHV